MKISMRVRVLSVLLLSIVTSILVYNNRSAWAEQVGSSPESGTSSRIKTIYDSLITLGHGSTEAGVWGDWGVMWNRIRSAAEWVPNGSLAEADVVSGKTFYNLNRVQKTGTLTFVGNAVASEVCVGRTFYSNDGSLKTGSQAVVGASCGGGKIAYVLINGDPGYDVNVPHGLIAAISDQSTTATWGCSGTAIPGAAGTAIGTGHQNTHDMAAAGCTNAATLANAYAGGGYTDWFIPSLDELSKLHTNQSSIGGFSAGDYWSSTEGTANTAWYRTFGTANQNADTKSNPKSLRVIRVF